MLIYSEELLLPNGLECEENAAPPSQVYAFSTAIQMITEYNVLWLYAVLQWHIVHTKNRHYQ
jgi:hypothetical protein